MGLIDKNGAPHVFRAEHILMNMDVLQDRSHAGVQMDPHKTKEIDTDLLQREVP